MQTLNEPMYEINQNSEHYKKAKWRKDQQGRINEIITSVALEYGFDAEALQIYSHACFGFKWHAPDVDKFKEHLTKNSDRNGIHTFKKTSKLFKEISPKLKELTDIDRSVNPFALHDIFGLNNLVASQWIGNRLFVSVKDQAHTEKLLKSEGRSTQYPVEPVKHISYKEYLQLFISATEQEVAG